MLYTVCQYSDNKVTHAWSASKTVLTYAENIPTSNIRCRNSCILNQNEKYTFIIQISNTILTQCISLCLYKIRHITKATQCLKVKVMHHAYQGDNYYSENRQFM